MLYNYNGTTYTGSREEIIESLRLDLEDADLVLKYQKSRKSLHLGKEEFWIDGYKSFSINYIRINLINLAIAKVPNDNYEITMHRCNSTYFLMVDGEELASQDSQFTFNQILEHCGIKRIQSTFDIEISVSDLYDGHHSLNFDNQAVRIQDRPFTVFDIIERIIQ